MSSFDLYQTVTDQIVTMLEAGVVPWRSPILGRSTQAGHPKNLNTGKQYRGVNVVSARVHGVREGLRLVLLDDLSTRRIERGGNVKQG